MDTEKLDCVAFFLFKYQVFGGHLTLALLDSSQALSCWSQGPRRSAQHSRGLTHGAHSSGPTTAQGGKTRLLRGSLLYPTLPHSIPLYQASLTLCSAKSLNACLNIPHKAVTPVSDSSIFPTEENVCVADEA